MASFTEKCNMVASLVSSLSQDSAERYAIASIVEEMYRYEINKTFSTIIVDSDKKEPAQAPQVPDAEAK